jgi:hypothetical protein
MRQEKMRLVSVKPDSVLKRTLVLCHDENGEPQLQMSFDGKLKRQNL